MEKIILKLTADIFKYAKFVEPHKCPIAIAAIEQLSLADNETPFEGVDVLGIYDNGTTTRAYKHTTYNFSIYLQDYSQAKMCGFSSKEIIRELELIPV